MSNGKEKSAPALVIADPWAALRRFTPARLALGRAGDSLPTDAVLRFGLAHAMARDAVHQEFDRDGLKASLQAAGFEVVSVRSQAVDRFSYLARPDLGRRLDQESRRCLLERSGMAGNEVVIVIADGLSALAVETHALPVMQALKSQNGREQGSAGAALPPIVIASQARVALGDEIGQLLRARAVVVMIGERPGLSSPDSMGIYLTFAPQVGRTDAERNCISNIRPAGLPYPDAAQQLSALLGRVLAAGCSGVALPDRDLLGGTP